VFLVIHKNLQLIQWIHCSQRFSDTDIPVAVVRKPQVTQQRNTVGAATSTRTRLLTAAGFFISYNSSALQPNVTESVGHLLQLHPNSKLYVIGHSMGAAMATVCVLDLKFRYNLDKEKVFLYTFGSPRIGNDIFAKFLKNQVKVRGPPAISRSRMCGVWLQTTCRQMGDVMHVGFLGLVF
jgi:hypothetical protein